MFCTVLHTSINVDCNDTNKSIIYKDNYLSLIALILCSTNGYILDDSNKSMEIINILFQRNFSFSIFYNNDFLKKICKYISKKVYIKNVKKICTYVTNKEYFIFTIIINSIYNSISDIKLLLPYFECSNKKASFDISEKIFYNCSNYKTIRYYIKLFELGYEYNIVYITSAFINCICKKCRDDFSSSNNLEIDIPDQKIKYYIYFLHLVKKMNNYNLVLADIYSQYKITESNYLLNNIGTKKIINLIDESNNKIKLIKYKTKSINEKIIFNKNKKKNKKIINEDIAYKHINKIVITVNMLNLNEKINDFYINITKLGYSSNVNIFFDNNSIAKFLIHTCINNDCDDKLCTYTVYRDYLLKNNIINEFEDEMLTKVFDYKYNILIPEISNIISNIKYHVSIKDINDTLLIIRKNLIEEMLDIESTLLDVVYISSLYSGICFKKLVKLDKIRNNLLYFFT